jgi:murein DD-endopeptidase MepM/ murein hydrolase activator NlpD
MAAGCASARTPLRIPTASGASLCLDFPISGRRLPVSFGFRADDHPFAPGEHRGIDIPMPVGTEVLAVGDGVVRVAGPNAIGANVVAIDMAGGWSYEAVHLLRIDVAVGDRVARGRRLGLSGGEVGATGSGPFTTGPHLHFELLREGSHMDPAPYFCPFPDAKLP